MAKNMAEGVDLSPSEIADVRRFIRDQWDEDTPYDVVVDGTTTNADDTSVVAEYEAAGATWWLEARDWDTSEDELMARIRSGPPRVQGD